MKKRNVQQNSLSELTAKEARDGSSSSMRQSKDTIRIKQGRGRVTSTSRVASAVEVGLGVHKVEHLIYSFITIAKTVLILLIVQNLYKNLYVYLFNYNAIVTFLLTLSGSFCRIHHDL